MSKPSSIINLPKKTPNNIGYVHAVPNKRGGVTFSTFISEPIFETESYLNLIFALNVATENDDFIIKLASPGGSIETGILLCNAIFNCKAKVTTQAVGITASIAAVIWCCGKVKSLLPTSTLMFHMPSGFGGGKTADIAEQAEFFQKYFKELLRSITKNVLNEDEFNDMTAGRRDVFLSYETLKNRLTRKDI